MYKLQFLNYCAVFSVSGDISYRSGVVKDFKNFRRTGDVCFAQVFYGRVRTKTVRLRENYETEPISATYRIRCLKYNDNRRDSIDSNVLINKEQVVEFIDFAKTILPFECKVTEYNNYFLFVIKIEKLNILYHKFILTWVRYLYEYPYNLVPFFMHDFVQKYDKIDPTCLYHHILRNLDNYGTGHCMDSYEKFPTATTAEQVLENMENSIKNGGNRLNGIFVNLHDKRKNNAQLNERSYCITNKPHSLQELINRKDELAEEFIKTINLI